MTVAAPADLRGAPVRAAQPWQRALRDAAAHHRRRVARDRRAQAAAAQLLPLPPEVHPAAPAGRHGRPRRPHPGVLQSLTRNPIFIVYPCCCRLLLAWYMSVGGVLRHTRFPQFSDRSCLLTQLRFGRASLWRHVPSQRVKLYPFPIDGLPWLSCYPPTERPERDDADLSRPRTRRGRAAVLCARINCHPKP